MKLTTVTVKFILKGSRSVELIQFFQAQPEIDSKWHILVSSAFIIIYYLFLPSSPLSCTYVLFYFALSVYSWFFCVRKTVLFSLMLINSRETEALLFVKYSIIVGDIHYVPGAHPRPVIAAV